jgi:hypothetical protein
MRLREFVMGRGAQRGVIVDEGLVREMFNRRVFEV